MQNIYWKAVCNSTGFVLLYIGLQMRSLGYHQRAYLLLAPHIGLFIASDSTQHATDTTEQNIENIIVVVIGIKSKITSQVIKCTSIQPRKFVYSFVLLFFKVPLYTRVNLAFEPTHCFIRCKHVNIESVCEIRWESSTIKTTMKWNQFI